MLGTGVTIASLSKGLSSSSLNVLKLGLRGRFLGWCSPRPKAGIGDQPVRALVGRAWLDVGPVDPSGRDRHRGASYGTAAGDRNVLARPDVAPFDG